MPGVQVGDTFVIQTGGWRFESGAGTLDVMIEPAPANDDCSGATAIQGVGTYAFDSTHATSSDFETTHGCELSADNAFDADVFYAWTADEDGDYFFDTSGSAGLADTQLAIYSGDCMTPVCLGQDDDGGAGQASRLQVDGVLMGQTLLVQIGGTAGQSGSGQLDVSLVPYGTSCELAEEIAGEGMFPYDTTGFPTTGFGAGGCLTVEQDFFFAWTVSMDGDYVIDTRDTPYDTRLAIYSGDCMSPVCVDSNEDIDTMGGTLQSEVTLEDLLVGQIYWIHVGGPSGVEGPGSLTIDRMVDPCELVPDDGFEDNDDCLSAVSLPAMTASYTGLHVQALDPDFFTVALPPGEVLTLQETLDSNETDYDVFEDAACGVLLATVTETYQYTNTSAGTVDLVVRAHNRMGSKANCGDYDLDLIVVPDPCLQADDGFEDNDDCLSATPLVPGSYTPLQIRDGGCGLLLDHATGGRNPDLDGNPRWRSHQLSRLRGLRLWLAARHRAGLLHLGQRRHAPPRLGDRSLLESGVALCLPRVWVRRGDRSDPLLWTGGGSGGQRRLCASADLGGWRVLGPFRSADRP